MKTAALLLLLISIASAACVGTAGCPASLASGATITIPVADVCVCSDESSVLTGNLVVNGELTINNVDLAVNVAANGQYGISVNSGGSLNITGVGGISTITSNDAVHAYTFKANSGSVLEIYNTAITYCGYETLSSNSGLYINTNNAIINNVNFSLSLGDGIFLDSASGVLINNTIVLDGASTQFSLAIANSDNNQIENSNFTDYSYTLILSNGDNNNFTNNNFTTYFADDLQEVGVDIEGGSTYNNFTNNLMYSYETYSLFLWTDNDDYNSFTGNNITSNGTIAVFIGAGSDYNEFYSNNIYNSTQVNGDHTFFYYNDFFARGPVITSDYNTFYGNNANLSAQFAYSLTSSSHNTFDSDILQGSKFTMYITPNSANNTFQNMAIYSTGSNAVDISTTGSNYFINSSISSVSTPEVYIQSATSGSTYFQNVTMQDTAASGSTYLFISGGSHVAHRQVPVNVLVKYANGTAASNYSLFTHYLNGDHTDITLSAHIGVDTYKKNSTTTTNYTWARFVAVLKGTTETITTGYTTYFQVASASGSTKTVTFNTDFPFAIDAPYRLRIGLSTNQLSQQNVVIDNINITSAGMLAIANPDGSDLRFYYVNSIGQQEAISYYLKNYSASPANVSVSLKIPLTDNNGNAIVYAYYGNSSYTSLSNSTLIFPSAAQESFNNNFSQSGWSVLPDTSLTSSDGSIITYYDSVYLFGGYGGGQRAVQKYNITTSTWEVRPGDIPIPAAGTAWGMIAVKSGTDVFLFGNHGNDNNVYKFNLETEVWTTLAGVLPASLQTNTGGILGVEYNGLIYLAGLTGALFTFNPTTEVFTQISTLPNNHVWGLMANYQDLLVITSGTTATQTTDIYNVTSNSWSSGTISSALNNVYGMGRENPIIGDTIYVITGKDDANNFFDIVYAYNITSDTWTKKSGGVYVRDGVGVGVVDNSIYVIGGRNDLVPTPTSLAQKYTPSSDSSVFSTDFKMYATTSPCWQNASAGIDGTTYGFRVTHACALRYTPEAALTSSSLRFKFMVPNINTRVDFYISTNDYIRISDNAGVGPNVIQFRNSTATQTIANFNYNESYEISLVMWQNDLNHTLYVNSTPTTVYADTPSFNGLNITSASEIFLSSTSFGSTTTIPTSVTLLATDTATSSSAASSYGPPSAISEEDKQKKVTESEEAESKKLAESRAVVSAFLWWMVLIFLIIVIVALLSNLYILRRNKKSRAMQI